MQIDEPNIDICNYPGMFVVIWQLSRKGYLGRIIGSTNDFEIFLIRQTWDGLNKRSWWLLNEKNIKLFFVF